MPTLYAVIGHPVKHSLSPFIHAAFAAQTGQDVQYERLLAPLDDFAGTLAQFRARGGQGANVTVPFKQTAFALADIHRPRARLAQAANTLLFTERGLEADNTDGAGLVNDLCRNLDFHPAGTRILLLGAGGAARGAAVALLAEQPAQLVVVNRTTARAQELAQQLSGLGRIEAHESAQLTGQAFDCVINATAASLAGESILLPTGLFADGSLAYDMMYGDAASAFLAAAREHGASRVSDGLGMLVEQAALSFALWRQETPETAPVLQQLRARLRG